MNRTIARFALFGLACVIPLVHLAAQGTPAQGAPDPWYSRQARPQNIDEPKTFTGAFRIELPKNWQFAPGHTGTIFSVVEGTKKWATGGLITLEYLRLQVELEPALIPGVGERELKELQSQELSGKRFSGSIKNGPAGPIIFIQYDRPGISGTDDHVVQYSIPIGTTMYRLICIAPTAEIEKYRPMFAHVAYSFSPMKQG
jgi:hypothetical protein